MIIRLIAASRSIEINDPGNFKAFSVPVPPVSRLVVKKASKIFSQ